MTASRSFEDLDRRASTLDELTGRDRTVEHAAEESAKRRFLLLDLEALGVFDADFAMPPGMPTLEAYRSAGLRVAEYLASEPRRRFNPEAAVQPIVGSPVSVDWFRFPSPVPDHLSPLEWLAYCENILAHAEHAGGAGEIFARAGDKWWTLRWRTDDGIHPALVSAHR